LYISPDFWNGVPALGNVFTFDIDTTTMSEVIFSESPTATPISDLFQLYWGEYPIYSGEGVNNLTPSGIYKNIGDKTDTSSTSKTSFDAPIVTVNEVHYNAPGTQMMAGKYEYVQTYVVHDSTVLGGFAESGPSGAGEVELKADPLPPPANPPAVALEPFPGPPYDSGGPDKGTHRWAYSYVSDFGETQLGEPGGQFEINSGFVPDPTVEPEISYEGAGSLFLDGRESARAWVYTWVTPYGESGPSPARSVQMLDVPGSVYGIRVGIHWPAPPAGVVGINVYRTHYGGGTGDFTQINESGLYYFLGTSSTVGFLVDTGGGLPIGATAPALNTTGGGAYISLTSIQAGPPGTRKKRIYRTIAGDSGPFVYVDEISYADTTYVDRFNDAYIQALNPTFVPADPRIGAPRLPYDSDLSADQTHMAGSVRVELPKVPVPVAPQTVEKVKVYRSKKNKTGTHYFLRERSSPVIQGDLGANDSFIDSTADADLGDGLEQTERPPFGASGERDHLSGIALRVRHSKAILAKSIGVMVGKVGAPTADVTISVLGRHRIDQPEGDTLFSVTIAAAQVVGFQMQKRRIEATIIPPGWCWIVVDTPDADADNYYYISLAPAKADQVRFAKSSLQAKWIPQGGGIVFEIDGANFTLEPNAIDEAGQPVARAVLDVEIPSGIELSCDTKGLLDNGTGTYTGTAGALITNGADIAHWIGSYLGGLDETLIDVAGTFAATKAKYGTLFNNLSISIQENMTVLELLLRLGMETRSIPDWSFDRLEWKWLPAGIDPPYTPYKTLHRGDIVNESNDPQAEPKVNIERFGMDGVINSIDLKWDRKAWLQVNDPQAYARITSGQDVASVTKYTELTREDLFNFNFIHDEESAIALVAFYLSRYGTPNKALVTLTLVAPFLDIEKDDIVDFDGTTSAFGSGAFGTGPYGGGSGTGILYDGLIPNSIYQVEGKTVHPDFTVTLVLREL
jgi:hypothetical protein